MRRLLLLFTLSCLGLSPALSQDRDYGRSMVITDHGIVATSHVLASQAGAQILSQGARLTGSGGGAAEEGPRFENAEGLFRVDGTGTSCASQLENWYEFCCFRSEGRRFGGAGTDSWTIAALTNVRHRLGAS
jgi:hypothetical protein